MQQVKVGEIPPVMKDLLGKDFTVTLELNEDNVKFGSNVYEACDLALGFLNIAANKPTSESTGESSEESSDASSTRLETESEENMKENVGLHLFNLKITWSKHTKHVNILCISCVNILFIFRR